MWDNFIEKMYINFFLKKKLYACIYFCVRFQVIQCVYYKMQVTDYGGKNNQKIEFILKQLTWNGHFYLVSYVFVSGIH